MNLMFFFFFFFFFNFKLFEYRKDEDDAEYKVNISNEKWIY